MIPVKETSDSLEFKVLAVPRSSKNQIVGSHGDALKVKLKAPPVDGAANKMCISFLAKTFRIPKTDLEIIAGQSSRQKQVLARFSTDKQGKENLLRLKALIAGYK